MPFWHWANGLQPWHWVSFSAAKEAINIDAISQGKTTNKGILNGDVLFQKTICLVASNWDKTEKCVLWRVLFASSRKARWSSSHTISVYYVVRNKSQQQLIEGLGQGFSRLSFTELYQLLLCSSFIHRNGFPDKIHLWL